MAVSAIARVIQRLIQQNGMMGGIKKAQKLGFPDTKIKQAVKSLQVRRQPRSTFGQRKEGRIMEADWKQHMQDPDLTGTMF